MGECIVNEGETLIDSRVNNSSTCIQAESVVEFPRKAPFNVIVVYTARKFNTTKYSPV